MRIIPKKTNVKMQFFRNIGVIDMAVLLVGGLLAFTILLSGLPFRLPIFLILLVLTIGIVIPIDDDKPYMMAYYAIKHLARHKLYRRAPAAPAAPLHEETAAEEAGQETEAAVRQEEAAGQQAGDGAPDGKKGKKAEKKEKADNRPKVTVEDITAFTAINGAYIEYGKSYSATVIQISPVEFRLFSLSKQNAMIDRVLAAVLRTVTEGETAALIKVDRPMIYDKVLKNEESKLEDLKKAYVYGMYSEEELTERIGIIHDRMAQIERFNSKDQIFVPTHYLVFFHRTKEHLKDQTESAISTLTNGDIPARQLKGPELAVFLKYNVTQFFDEREVYKLKPEEYRDWIMPHEIEIFPRMIRFDDTYLHTLRVTKFPTTVPNAWGADLFNIPGVRVAVKIKPLDHYRSVRQIDHALQELQEQASHTEKASTAMELDTHIQSITEVLRLLQGDNEVLFSTDVYLTAYDYDYSDALARYRRDLKEYGGKSVDGVKLVKPMPKMKRELRRMCSELGFGTSDMTLQQFEAYTSSQVSANDALAGDSHSIHAGSVAAAFPYVLKYLNDENGIYIGDTAGVPAFLNFFMRNRERVNSNCVVIGKSGSGKSFATKTILTHLAAENAKIFILDPENEYTLMAKNFHGKIIDVGTAAQGRLNPFHVITNLADDEATDEDSISGGENESMTLNTHLQFLEEFYRQILPGIDQDALEYLNNLTMQVYEEKGIYNDTKFSELTPEDFPTFDDLYEKLINDFQRAQGDYAKTNLRILINYISKFAEGGRDANLWNGPATLDTSENFIVFNFQSLLANKNNLVANAQMLLVMKWLDNEIIKNRDYNLKHNANRRVIVVIDEAHVFIDSKYPIALDFMFQLAKRIRKYNGMQIVITQNIKDFVGTEEIARKSTAIINASQYSFIFPLSPNDMSDLVRLYENAGSINETEQNDIVNNGRGRAFLITEPQARTSVDIIADPALRKLFSVENLEV